MSVNARDLLERLQSGPASEAQAPARPRRFVGTSMREVYAKVRAALGPDALILEQRSEGGRVEVLAALEAPEQDGGPARERVVARLRELGLGSGLLSRLPARLRRAEDVLDVLAEAVPCAPPPEPLCGRFRLVGPPGAGKTTALIKLAASRVLRYGRFGTLLIATDRSRLAGCEQVASSAELLGVEYVECPEHAVPEVLARHRHMQLVLIDSAGVRGDIVPGALDGVDDLLVVPSMWQTAALRRLRRLFHDHPVRGLVLTHTDQAETLLECVNLLSEWGSPLWWTGQSGDLAVELEPAATGAIVTGLTTPFDRSSLASIFAG